MNTPAAARRDGIRIAKLMIRAAKKTAPKPPLHTVHRARGRKPFFDFAACGTPKQYQKHRRYGIPMCEACRRAENRRVQDRRKKFREPTRDSNLVQVC